MSDVTFVEKYAERQFEGKEDEEKNWSGHVYWNIQADMAILTFCFFDRSVKEGQNGVNHSYLLVETTLAKATRKCISMFDEFRKQEWPSHTQRDHLYSEISG